MTTIKRVLWLLVISLLILPLLAWGGDRPFMIKGIRPVAMGGAFTAIADDANAYFYNPAGLTQIQKWQVQIANLPVTISADTLDLYNWVNDNRTQLEKFDEQTHDTQVKLMNDITDRVSRFKVHVSGSILNPNFISSPIALSNNLKLNFGIGLFSLYDAHIGINAGLLVPNITMIGNVDAAGLAPLAFKMEKTPFDLPGSLSLAGTIKILNRGSIEELRKSVLEFEEFEPKVQRGKGVGLDFGSLYQLNEQWNFGLLVADIFGTPITYDEATSNNIKKPETTAIINPRVNFGVAFRPQNFYFWKNKFIPLSRHFVFAADVTDITNPAEKLFGATFFKKLHLGAEYQTRLLSFRGGFNSGYPSFGLGLNLWLIKLDYAFSGEELGLYAGQIDEWNHMVSLSIGF
ncbi:MAG: hypothetical protein HY920_02945 [Elusimicrobia bacterium]|nr:hypothetical protein [Elusimicrobiota bacterium]